MKSGRTAKYISVLLCIPALLFVSGIAAQFAVNYRAWTQAGSSRLEGPALPSFAVKDILAALMHFPEGAISLAAVTAAAVILCIYETGALKTRAGGIADRERNLTVSGSGAFGTASFMDRREADDCFDITAASNTDRDILGMVRNGKVITIRPGLRLNENIAVCGASGSGKSRCVSRNLIFQAALRGESIICTDPKSELYESMSRFLRDRGYEVKVFNLVQMEHSDSWNCLGEIKGDEQMAQIFSDVVLKNTSGEHYDEFWYSAELNLLKALVLYVSLELPEKDRNLWQVYRLLTQEDERSLCRIMDRIRSEHTNDELGTTLPPSPACAPFSIFRQAGPNVRGNVITGLGSKLQVMQTQAVKNITSFDDIDLEKPGRQKCAYFCIVSDQDSTFNFLSSLFFSFLFIKLIRYADSRCEEGRLEPKVKFILDEFTNCCLIPDFTKKCSTIRSRGISVSVFFQNVGQLRNRYPNDQWQEILGACDTTLFLGCNDEATSEYFSKRTGIASVEVESVSENGRDPGASGSRKTRSVARRQLMNPDEIMGLDTASELLFIRGHRVMKALRYDYTRHPLCHELRPSKAVKHEPDWKTGGAFSSVPTPPRTGDGDKVNKAEKRTERRSYDPERSDRGDGKPGRRIKDRDVL